MSVINLHFVPIPFSNFVLDVGNRPSFRPILLNTHILLQTDLDPSLLSSVTIIYCLFEYHDLKELCHVQRNLKKLAIFFFKFSIRNLH